ncbi:rho-associated protein kinase 2-like isoform X1, partial [Tachysurus ichikawai]
MTPGAEKRLESQLKMLESMIRDQRSALNLASLLVRRTCAFEILVCCFFNTFSYVLFAVLNYLKTY